MGQLIKLNETFSNSSLTPLINLDTTQLKNELLAVAVPAGVPRHD